MYNEMQFEDLNPKPKIFQAELTKAQYKFLAKLMPSEYVLEVISKPKKEVPPQPKRNPMINKTAIAKPPRSKTDDAAGIPTNPLDFSLSMESTTTFPPSKQANQSAQSSQVGMMPDMFGSHPMMYQFHPSMGTQQPNNFQLQEAQSPKKDKSKLDKNQLKPKKKIGEEKQRQTSTAPNTKPFKAPTEIMAKCANILQSLKRNSLAEPFLYPVDPKSMGVPSFYTLVKEPMDLSTVEKKLKNNDYLNSSQFVADVRKIWKNALTSNAQGSDTFRRAQEMSRLFEEAVKELDALAQKPAQEPSSKVEKKPPGKPQQQPQSLQMPPAQGQIPRQSNGPASNLGNITIVDTESSNFRQMAEQQPLSQAEKQTLHQKILTKIPAQSLKGVWEIVSESFTAPQSNKEMLEFDLEAGRRRCS